MRGRFGTIQAERAKGNAKHQVCQRCGIDRKKDGRKGPLCRDCYQVDPNWGKVSYR
jgi:hypothetical protein